MLLVGSPHIRVKCKIDNVDFDADGVCFGAAIQALRTRPDRTSLKKEMIEDIEFSLSRPTYNYGKTPSKDAALTKEEVDIFLSAGREMFGWKFDPKDFSEMELPPVLSIPATEQQTNAFFQVGWLRTPFEINSAFRSFTNTLSKFPTSCRSPLHPTFWLTFMKDFSIHAVPQNHNIMPGCGEYNCMSTSRKLFYPGTLDLAIPLAMVAFIKDRKFTKDKTIHKSIQEVLEANDYYYNNRGGYDPQLWQSILAYIPPPLNIRTVVVPIANVLVPSVRSTVKRGFDFLIELLEGRNKKDSPLSRPATMDTAGNEYVLDVQKVKKYLY